MAGQGLNLGLGDAACLAAALASAKEMGADIGEVGFLTTQYEGPRQRENLMMMGALEGLQRVFGVQGGEGWLGQLGAMFGAARSGGMAALNAAGPVKNRVMWYAMGL
jgi:2-polyprenyl-6-methoxyphenol hydroxylase-like FAD-dependent oxidoreductase